MHNHCPWLWFPALAAVGLGRNDELKSLDQPRNDRRSRRMCGG